MAYPNTYLLMFFLPAKNNRRMESSVIDLDWKTLPKSGKKITSNLKLVPGNMPFQVVLRKTRKSGSFIDFLKFHNEMRIYRFLSNNPNQDLHYPEVYNQIQGKALFIEFLRGSSIANFKDPQFASAYVAFQHQDIPVNPVLDFLNQSLRGFDYKIGGVALFTLARQESFGLALKVVKTYNEFCKGQYPLTKRYWQHGDLHRRNVIVTEDNTVYLIDFENCFFTKKWPLCEIFGECIQCEEGGIVFYPELFQLYWKALPKDSPIFNLDLDLQLKFAMLRKAVHVILQSKFEFRRSFYKQFLEEKLESNDFQNWSHSILSRVEK